MSDIYDRSALPGWTPEQRRRAVRAVAAAAVDADERAELLAMLGLHPSEGVLSPEERAS